MLMRVRVTPDGSPDPAPAPGTPVHVEVRDESVADGVAPVLASGDGAVEADGRSWSAELRIDVPESVSSTSGAGLWARVGAGPRTAAGDWITMQSCPVQVPAPDPVTVPVRRVG